MTTYTKIYWASDVKIKIKIKNKNKKNKKNYKKYIYISKRIKNNKKQKYLGIFCWQIVHTR